MEKATDLNLQKKFIIVYCALLDIFPQLDLPSQHFSFFFFLSLPGDGISGGDLGHLGEVLSFHGYLPRIQELYMILNFGLFFFCYFLFCYLKLSGRT